MNRPSGIHHLAVMTKDMKGQIEFFTQVLGLSLVALYWMHGAEGVWHGFLRLDDTTYLAFCQGPGVEDVASTVGLTHAGHAGGVSAPGTMQHVAFSVADGDELRALRDRLRSHGVVALGPIDHGMCESLYFAGPEGLTLEAACSSEPIDPECWIDPEVVELAGITPEELQRFRNPPEFARPATAVAQPEIDPAKPHLAYPEAQYRHMVAMSDDVVAKVASVTEPPVPRSGDRP